MPRARTWTAEVRQAVPGVVGIVVGLFVALAGAAGAVNPFVHTICANGGPVSVSVATWIPAIILNSPYGGESGGNVTGGPGDGMSMWGAENGSAYWAGYRSLLTIDALQNQTVPGLGRNDRCGSAVLIEMSRAGPLAEGILLLGPGNPSDATEPRSLILGEANNITFNNSFSRANAEEISTCAGSAVHRTVVAPGPTVWYSYVSSDMNRTILLHVPLAITDYNYTFPANFGSWAIDNLSVPGGPGGGWAFEYLGPCS